MPDEESKHKFDLTEIEEFHETLNAVKAKMPDEQQRLLQSILVLAWAAVEEEEAKLANGFSGSFTPEQGSLLADFTKGGVSLRPQLFRGFIKL
ncbi:hypothetical protein [Amycolatopsis rifamycinica]|uniref:Uncharacterized protein n=1 Tax=Amycolatopsis rifamycinica TaxID=287986 RepID=A0A066U3Q9_9PSEU|nr:hypothetical protein [Amycolatopsis rifamycinica]KDN18739.1 hypothetical protein DV20_29555 [Amycolatopsis rifamycinica]